MLKRILVTGSLALLLVISWLPAHADTITYTAVLTGATEVPPTGSTATGFATFVLDTVLNTLSISESFTGLTTPASAAHIHCCGPAGTNQPVAVPFAGFPTTTSGTYSNTVDLTLASTYTSAYITAQGGTVALAEAALIAGLNSQNTYANIHNTTFPGGEIRGIIMVATPEPGSLLLLGTGMIGVVQAIRRRVRA